MQRNNDNDNIITVPMGHGLTKRTLCRRADRKKHARTGARVPAAMSRHILPRKAGYVAFAPQRPAGKRQFFQRSTTILYRLTVPGDRRRCRRHHRRCKPYPLHQKTPVNRAAGRGG